MVVSKQVVLPYDPVWRALEWAKQNCPGYITNRATVDGKICYYFANEKEATMFMLRWM